MRLEGSTKPINPTFVQHRAKKSQSSYRTNLLGGGGGGGLNTKNLINYSSALDSSRSPMRLKPSEQRALSMALQFGEPDETST